MAIRIREARPGDEAAVVGLMRELAQTEGETTPLTETFAGTYLKEPDCHILLAEVDGHSAGLLSYSVRPSLWHAGPAALIEDVIVSQNCRNSGIGSALMAELLHRLQTAGFTEVSVAVMPNNEKAQRFYRSHGLVEEEVFLERHF